MARELCKRSCKESPKLVLIGYTATAHERVKSSFDFYYRSYGIRHSKGLQVRVHLVD